MSDEVARAELPTTPDYRFYITRRSGTIEDVGAKFADFTRSHVLFRDQHGVIVYGLHADDVREITQEEEG